ncbi:MAG: hypothetical protein ACT6FG_04240 [Methanosarcinaceae archaeon]
MKTLKVTPDRCMQIKIGRKTPLSFEYMAGAPIASSPAVAFDGMVYIGNWAGKLGHTTW